MDHHRLSQICLTLCVLLTGGCSAASAAGEAKIDRTFRLGASPRVKVAGVRGAVTIKGGAGAVVRLVAVRRGGTAEQRGRLRVEIHATGAGLEVKTRCSRVWGLSRCGRARVDYQLQVPAAAHVTARSVSGVVSASGVAGGVTLRSVSGATNAHRVAGRLDLKTVSGPVQVELRSRPRSVRIGSVSGDVTVRVGGGVGLDLGLNTVSGRFSSSLPSASAERRRMRSLRLQIQGGGAALKVGTVSGDLALLPL